MAWTNIGKQRMFEQFFEASSAPSDFYLAASPSSAEFNASTVYVSSVGEVTASGGYVSGGLLVERGGGVSGFLTTTGVDFAIAELSPSGSYVLSASEGTINDVKVFMLTDDRPHAEGAGGREIYAYWSTGSDVDIGGDSTLTITSASLQGT